MRAMISYRRQLVILLATLAVMLSCVEAKAVIEPARSIFLEERNTAVTYDDTEIFPNWRGLIDWRVDGVGQLFEQSFWFGPTGLPETPVIERAFNHASVSSDRGQLNVNHRTSGPFGFDVLVSYGLIGQPLGSGLSFLLEEILIQNRSSLDNSFSFFVYNDFDLEDTAANDIGVAERGGSRITQADRDSRTFLTADLLVVSKNPNRYAIAAHSEGDTSLILRSLEDSRASNFANTGSGSAGDITWVWQWYVDLAPAGSLGDSHRIRMLYSINRVPEPGSLTLLSLGLAVLAFRTIQYRRETCNCNK